MAEKYKLQIREGTTIGRLTILRKGETKPSRREREEWLTVTWVCRCTCGRVEEVRQERFLAWHRERSHGGCRACNIAVMHGKIRAKSKNKAKKADRTCDREDCEHWRACLDRCVKLRRGAVCTENCQLYVAAPTNLFAKPIRSCPLSIYC